MTLPNGAAIWVEPPGSGESVPATVIASHVDPDGKEWVWPAIVGRASKIVARSLVLIRDPIVLGQRVAGLGHVGELALVRNGKAVIETDDGNLVPVPEALLVAVPDAPPNVMPLSTLVSEDDDEGYADDPPLEDL